MCLRWIQIIPSDLGRVKISGYVHHQSYDAGGETGGRARGGVWICGWRGHSRGFKFASFLSTISPDGTRVFIGIINAGIRVMTTGTWNVAHLTGGDNTYAVHTKQAP